MNTKLEKTASLPRPPIGESRLVRKNKVVINYFIRGTGESVILLPAFARSVSDYNELVMALNEAGYRTIAVEPRGMGQSASPILPRATMHDFAEDVADVIGDLDVLVGGKVHVLGRAFGARVGRTFTTNYPQLVQSVILLAGGGMISITKSRLLPYMLGNSRFMPETLRLKAVRATLYARSSTVPRHLAYRHPFRAMRRQIFAMRTSLDHIWRDSPVPILWIHGEQDRLVPLKNATNLFDRFPDQIKLVVIPNAGHALIPEQPEAVLKHITTFLREHQLSGNAV